MQAEGRSTQGASGTKITLSMHIQQTESARSVPRRRRLGWLPLLSAVDLPILASRLARTAHSAPDGLHPVRADVSPRAARNIPIIAASLLHPAVHCFALGGASRRRARGSVESLVVVPGGLSGCSRVLSAPAARRTVRGRGSPGYG